MRNYQLKHNISLFSLRNRQFIEICILFIYSILLSYHFLESILGHVAITAAPLTIYMTFDSYIRPFSTFFVINQRSKVNHGWCCRSDSDSFLCVWTGEWLGRTLGMNYAFLTWWSRPACLNSYCPAYSLILQTVCHCMYVP